MDNNTYKQTVDKSKNRINLIDNFFSAIVMSVLALIFWFVLSASVKKVGILLLVFAILLIVFNLISYKFVIEKIKVKVGRTVGTIVLVTLNIIVMLSITVFTLAGMMLFYPHFDEEAFNKLISNIKAEEIVIESSQGTISGWFYHNAEDKAPVVLYFGGNGENSSRRMLNNIESENWSWFEGYNFVMFDYPGYGKSDGNCTEATMKQMAVDVYDAIAVRDDVDSKQIVVMGYSIGTGAANYVASMRDVNGLLLMAPYSNGHDIYNNMLNIFHGPLKLLVSFKMESIKFAENVSIKPLVMATKDDELVPFQSSQTLANHYPNVCEFELYEGFTHNDFWGEERVKSKILQYLQEVEVNE